MIINLAAGHSHNVYSMHDQDGDISNIFKGEGGSLCVDIHAVMIVLEPRFANNGISF